jgi:hypothetical protein
MNSHTSAAQRRKQRRDLSAGKKEKFLLTLELSGAAWAAVWGAALLMRSSCAECDSSTATRAASNRPTCEIAASLASDTVRSTTLEAVVVGVVGVVVVIVVVVVVVVGGFDALTPPLVSGAPGGTGRGGRGRGSPMRQTQLKLGVFESSLLFRVFSKWFDLILFGARSSKHVDWVVLLQLLAHLGQTAHNRRA